MTIRIFYIICIILGTMAILDTILFDPDRYIRYFTSGLLIYIGLSNIFIKKD